ncbi:DASH complex subunit Dad3-domain-containing protein, partial [Melampsora americana]
MESSARIRQKTEILESEVLQEYKRLNDILNRMSDTAQDLASTTPSLLEGFLPLERKMGLVLTLFKASVWSVLVDKQRKLEAKQVEQADLSNLERS